MREVASGREAKGMMTGSLRGGSWTSSASFMAVEAIVADQPNPRPYEQEEAMNRTCVQAMTVFRIVFHVR